MPIKIKFQCPKEGCEYDHVEDDVDDVDYDFTDETQSGGVRSNISQVQCTCCDTPYDVEVVALGGEKRISVVGHPNVRVSFTDNTGDYTHILDGQIIDEEIARREREE